MLSLPRHRLWIAGEWRESLQLQTLVSPWNGEAVAEADQLTPEHMELALQAASDAFVQYRRVSRYARSQLLTNIAQGIRARREEFTQSIVSEAGKPWTLADGEVARAIGTFTIAAEEAKRLGGEVIPIDIDPGGRPYGTATSYHRPLGPVLGIAPFNFPLNLVAHKVAPALAVGASVIIKPPPQAPGAATLLAQVFAEAAAAASDTRDKIPLSAFQVLSGPNDVIGSALQDPRIAILSFTGSDQVGWKLQQNSRRKKVLLELGGNASVIVHDDADLVRAASRIAWGAFAYAGQVCISVQKVLVMESVAERFESLLLEEITRLHCGHPALKETLVGPLIDSKSADRVLAWIDEARQGGARVLCGATRQGNVILPTVVSGTQAHHRLSCDEVFGPVMTLDPYTDFSKALQTVNQSRFGLQAGIFTEQANLQRQAIETLDVGGLMINEVPTYRADQMPYGGFKDSGIGREGVRYAMEEFCGRQTVVTWRG